MALWLIVKERTPEDRTDSGVPLSDLPDPPPLEVPPTDADRLELVGIADANADQPKQAAEQVAQEPGFRYIAVRWDTATVFEGDPRPVSLTEVKKGAAK